MRLAPNSFINRTAHARLQNDVIICNIFVQARHFSKEREGHHGGDVAAPSTLSSLSCVCRLCRIFWIAIQPKDKFTQVGNERDGFF